MGEAGKRYRDDGVTVVLLANGPNRTFDPEALADGVAAALESGRVARAASRPPSS